MIRACRRDTFASGSSESRSTSGKMPPSASQRPICDSASLNMNCFPTDRPRSMTCKAWGLVLEPSDEEMFSAAPALLAVNSGWTTLEGACEPFCPSELPLKPPKSGPLERRFGLKGAPQSSQYCDPSKFSVLHLSQVIIWFFRKLASFARYFIVSGYLC